MKTTLKRDGKMACLLLAFFIFNACSSVQEKEAIKKDNVKEEDKPLMHIVEINKMKFEPAEIKVNKGDRVVFVNRDLVAHDVTEQSKKNWSSSPLTTDQNWVLVVTESVNYYCSLHVVMKGKIVVE